MKLRQISNGINSFYIANIDFFILLEIFLLKFIFFHKNVELLLNSFVLIISVLGVACILTPGFLFSYRYRFIFFIVLNSLLSSIMFIDTLYLSYFNDITSISLINQAGQVGTITGSIIRLLEWKYILYFIDIPILCIFYYYKIDNLISAYHHRVKKAATWIFSFGIILLTIFGSVILVDSVTNKYSQPVESRYSNKLLVEFFGIYNYHALDIYHYILNTIYKKEISPLELGKVERWFEDRNKDLFKGPLFGKARGQNVIVIQEEALQGFAVNLKINGQEVTPNLNKLIRESIYFNNYYDQTFHGSTTDAEFISLVSLYPSSMPGSIYFNFQDNNFNSLPKVLNKKGYMTMSAHAYNSSYWNRAIMHPNLGFQKSIFEEDLESGEVIGWGLSDEEFFKQVTDEILNLPEPFFSFLITLTNHHPYNHIPPNYKILKLGNLEGTLLGDYLHSTHYADKALGSFIDSLKENGLFDSSIIVVYGDHDAKIPEPELKKIGINSVFEKQYDKVPLIIHSPALNHIGGTINEQVSGQISLTPTLLYLLGIPQEDEFFMGQSIIDPPSNNWSVTFKDGSFINKGHIFISPNGTFKTGKFLNILTGEEDGAKAKLKDFETVQERLEVSDLMIEGDLYPELSEGAR